MHTLTHTHTYTCAGQAYILLQKGGQNSIIIVGGANQYWPDNLRSEVQNAISQWEIGMYKLYV